jgi:putative oxidoreductase
MTYRATDRKTAGLGQLLLRGSLGGTMIAHGLRHARTQEGTAAWFGSIGFRQPRLQVQLAAFWRPPRQKAAEPVAESAPEEGRSA